jgi:hypothetical protein
MVSRAIKSRTSQMIDAFVGSGGWKGFLPIAPSLQDNLRDLEEHANADDKLKYHILANEIPWTDFLIDEVRIACPRDEQDGCSD